MHLINHKILKLFTFISLFATLCNAAIVTVCASGCTTASLQSAFDTVAGCGDTIQIKSTEQQIGNFTNTYRGCTGGTPITVTSDLAITFISNVFARVTPSHLANMALITTNNSNPALSGVLDGMNRPPAHWKYIGVGFQTTTVTFFIVGFNSSGTAANSSQIADDYTFDRDYFAMPSTFSGNTAVLDVIRGDVTNLTVKNCFFGDAFWNGYIESHAVRMLTTAGPVNVTNNYITNSSIPIFVGGATPSYPAYLENGLTAQFNYTFRPWKYNGDPLQPNASQYVQWAQNTFRTGPWTITNVSNTGVLTTMGTPPFIPASLLDITTVAGCTVANANNWRISILGANSFQLLNFPGCNSAYISGGLINEYAATVCQKNQGELKWGTGVTWQYNGGENSWYSQSGCGNQFSGFTDTLRTQWDWNLTNPTIGTFTMADTTHISWSGTYRIGGTGTGSGNVNINDNAICLSISPTGTECHPIASISGASVITSIPFSATQVNPSGWIVYTGSAKLTNLTYSKNIMKNVDSAFSVLGLSFANGVGSNGFGSNHNITNNLFYANNSYITGYKGFNVSSAEADDNWQPTGFLFDHNTIYNPNGLANGAFVYLNGTGCPTCATGNTPKFSGGGYTNNLFGVSASGGNGPFSGDSYNTIGDVVNFYMSSNNVKNNAIPGGVLGPAATGGNVISGNQLQSWVDPFAGGATNGIFIVQPSSMYYHAGVDGASLGADFTLLPTITGITLTQFSGSVNLGFDVGTVNGDVKNTQPCVLEVSTSSNLQTDLGSYTVIPSVDPTLSAGADLSTKMAVTLVGQHVTWPITGLTTGTLYYNRLMCYGDTEFFSFTATGGGGSGGGTGVSGKVVITGTTIK